MIVNFNNLYVIKKTNINRYIDENKKDILEKLKSRSLSNMPITPLIIKILEQKNQRIKRLKSRLEIGIKVYEINNSDYLIIRDEFKLLEALHEDSLIIKSKEKSGVFKNKITYYIENSMFFEEKYNVVINSIMLKEGMLPDFKNIKIKDESFLDDIFKEMLNKYDSYDALLKLFLIHKKLNEIYNKTLIECKDDVLYEHYDEIKTIKKEINLLSLFSHGFNEKEKELYDNSLTLISYVNEKLKIR